MSARKVAIYTRISRDRVGAGLGVARQEADCRDLAERNRWHVVGTYTDNDLSAYSGKPRPGYRRLLDDIRAGLVDTVVAWHTDRLHRSPVELEEYITACEPRGVATHTVKAGPLDLSSPSGRMVARQLGAVARFEVEHQIERQQAAKAQAAAAGKWKGGRRPFGYESDGVTVRGDEAEVVRYMADAIIAGASIRSLVAELNEQGVVTSTGGPWRWDVVRSVLLRPRNAGLMEHRGQVVGKAVWPAILDEDKWRACASVLNNPARRNNWSSARKWLLSGLALCEVCAQGTHVTALGGRAGKPSIPCYTCPDRHVSRNAAEVDQLVTDVVLARLARPDFVDLVVINAGVDVEAAHSRALVVRERLNGLAEAYASGDIDAAQLSAGSTRLRAELADAESVLAQSAQGSVLTTMLDADDIPGKWVDLDLDRKRAMIDALMQITILRTAKGRPPGWRPGQSYFNPESVQIVWRST